MKVLVLSDLHLELGASFTVPDDIDYDVAVLAGDIHSPGTKAVYWAQCESTFGDKPVVLVPGNHEFYNRRMSVELEEMRKAAAGSNVHVLDRDEAVINGVRFIGCILWTDFMLPIAAEDGSMATDVEHALAEANRRLNDFRLIDVSYVEPPGRRRPAYRERRRPLRAEDTLAMHWVARDWLLRQLAKPFNGRTVVVTHHAPALASVARQYATDWLTPAFVSDLPSEFFAAPTLWVHGHTHSPFDYYRRTCRVVSNPRGYHMRDASFENRHFNPRFIVDIEQPQAEWEPIVDLMRAIEASPLFGKTNGK
jgi:predicted phosphodiesterase